jgi:hypothetical protein
MKLDLDYEKLFTVIVVICAFASILIHANQSISNLIWQCSTVILGVSSWYKKNRMDGTF